MSSSESGSAFGGVVVDPNDPPELTPEEESRLTPWEIETHPDSDGTLYRWHVHAGLHISVFERDPGLWVWQQAPWLKYGLGHNKADAMRRGSRFLLNGGDQLLSLGYRYDCRLNRWCPPFVKA